MRIKEIIIELDKLKTRCRVVDLDDKMNISELSRALKSSLNRYKGLGLTAPQIGYNTRMFIMSCGGRIITIINPIILEYGLKQNYMVEGCLSRPGFTRKVLRYTKIKVRYFDINSNRVSRRFEHMNARIFQHELDHLNGIVI